MSLSHSRPLSLRAVLVLAFVIQLVAIWSLVTWLSLRDGRQIVRDFSARLADGTLHQVHDRLQWALGAPKRLVEGTGSFTAGEQSKLPLTSMLAMNPGVDRIWQRKADGHGSMASRGPEPSGVQLVHFGAGHSAYDRLPRECIPAAKQAGGVAWCGPYVADGGRLVLSTVARIESVPTGPSWLVAELELDRLEALVHQIAGAIGARVFLLDDASRLILDSGRSTARRVVAGTMNFEPMEKSRDPLLKRVAQVLRPASMQDRLRIDAKGLDRAFTLALHRVPLPGTTPWKLGVLVPDEALVKDVSLNRDLTIALCLFIIVLAVFGAIGISRRISRPLARIVRRTQRVQAGDLEVDFQAGIAHEFIEIQQMAQALSQMVEGLRAKDRIYDALGRYVSPELASRFLTDPNALALGGQIQEVTILMSDLRGFTGLSERLKPEAMVQLLNRYLAAMTDVIHANRGTIIEFIGDAVFAVFGAPVSSADDAYRATVCAVQMARRLEAFNAAHIDQDLPTLEMGIGLHTGVVVAGNIGSERATKYGVVGEPVNVTARIESLTVGPMVLMSDATYQLVRHQVEVHHTRTVRLKGVSTPLRVHALQAVHHETRLEVPSLPDSPLVAVDVAVKIRPVIGKTVAARSISARLVALGQRRAVLRLSSSLNPLDRLAVSLLLPDGAVLEGAYATVQAVENSLDNPEHPVRAEVAFSSMPPVWSDAITTLRGASLEPSDPA